MQKIPVKSIIDQLDTYYSKENFKNAKELINFWCQSAIKFDDRGAQLTLENELIGLVRRTGEEMEGLAAIDRALLIIDRKMVSDEVAIATTWLNCATTYECFGHFDRALPMYQKAQEAYNRILSPLDPRMGGLYNNMAYAYRETGELDTAVEYTKRAIEIMRSNHELHDAAVSYVNLAEIYEEMLKVMEDASGTRAEIKDAGMNDIEMHQKMRDAKLHGSSEDLLLQIDNCLMAAYELLNDPANIRDGNYAYSLKKCVSGFEHFGYDTIKQELSVRAENIYAGNRTGKEIL